MSNTLLLAVIAGGSLLWYLKMENGKRNPVIVLNDKVKHSDEPQIMGVSPSENYRLRTKIHSDTNMNMRPMHTKVIYHPQSAISSRW